MRDLLARVLVSGLGAGCSPFASGTVGSAGAVGVFAAVVLASSGDVLAVHVALAAMAAAFGVACVAYGPWMQQTFGKDPSFCTADEWVGQAIALMLLPLGGGWKQWAWVAAGGFLAFRLFDILKPPPARQLEALPHGWGVLADDVAAGVMANLLCQLVFRVLLKWA